MSYNCCDALHSQMECSASSYLRVVWTCVCRLHKVDVLDERSLELAAWEASATERSVLRLAVYGLGLTGIALFAFMNVVYSLRFTDRENKQWILMIVATLLIGPRAWHRVVLILQGITCVSVCIPADAFVMQPLRSMLVTLVKFMWALRKENVETVIMQDITSMLLMEKARQLSEALSRLSSDGGGVGRAVTSKLRIVREDADAEAPVADEVEML